MIHTRHEVQAEAAAGSTFTTEEVGHMRLSMSSRIRSATRLGWTFRSELSNDTVQPDAGADSRHRFCLRWRRGNRCLLVFSVRRLRRLRLRFPFGEWLVMSTTAHYLLICAVAFACLTGCAHTRPTGARLTSSDVVRIAEQAATRDGIILSDYKRPDARYRQDGSWFVFFDGRGLIKTVGSHFAVFVDDRTGEARVDYGR